MDGNDRPGGRHEGQGGGRPAQEARPAQPAGRDGPVRPDVPARWELLAEVDRLTTVPLAFVSLAWLVLIIIDLVQGLPPALETLTWIIWGLFIVDVAIELLIAPNRPAYLRSNWLSVLSLALPALRVFRLVPALRILGAGRALRSISLLRVLTGVNRGLRALRATLERNGFAYVLGGTLLVALVGAAGLLAFEGPGEEARTLMDGRVGLRDYGDALWASAMLLVTIGSAFEPQTPEGRVLALLIAVYGFAVFGYITATLATILIGRVPEARGSQEGTTASDS